MGFRDLDLFNKAMLAKLSMRIIKFPESLMERTLRGKYFHDGVFLRAKSRKTDSITWRSILWGRELFDKGYRVDNGKQIYIDQDPWLVKKGSRVPLWVEDNLKGKRIEAILNEDGSWKEDTVKAFFLPEDADHILSIP